MGISFLAKRKTDLGVLNSLMHSIPPHLKDTTGRLPSCPIQNRWERSSPEPAGG